MHVKFSSAGGAMEQKGNLRLVGTLSCLLCVALMNGCVAQQADLKQAKRQLQQEIKQSNEEFLQTRARQSHEITLLREQELPRLQDQLQRAQHQAQELENKQDDLKQRAAVLEQQTREIDKQTKRLEQLATKMETDSTTRYTWVQKSLEGQDGKNREERDRLRGEVNSRLDEVNRQMELLRKDIIEAVQKTNSTLAKGLDVKLDEQRKSIAENQNRTEQLSAKFAQFSQALSGFRESLTGLAERIGQEEQVTKSLTAKFDTDLKASTAHVNETSKVMTGHLGEVNKSLADVAQKLASRIDEQAAETNNYVASVGQKLEARINDQDRRLDALAKTVDQVAYEARSGAGGNNTSHQQKVSPGQRSSSASGQDSTSQREQEVASSVGQGQEPSVNAVSQAGQASEAPTPQVVATVRPAERPDKGEYERLLNLFRDGKLEEARHGFAAFLSQYPNSDLAPNARYWLGESYYGKKEFKQAIDSYDRVELDYPQSEKVPAAILKKGYAYLALKDKKRASSAFKQVVTLYPKSPEAGKAYDKLNQLKGIR
jgi:tol-pal system protein YbgF